jgi:hypothetical protein
LTDNVILIFDVRKQRHPAEPVRQRLPIRAMVLKIDPNIDARVRWRLILRRRRRPRA